MELVCTTTALVLLAIILLCSVVFLRFRNTKRKNVPPGPSGWKALIDNYRGSRNRTLPYQVQEWSRQYGDLVYYEMPLFGSRLHLCSAQAARDVYAGKDKEEMTNDRPDFQFTKFFMNGKSITVQSASEATWARERKLLHSSLKFYGDGIARFESTIQQELDRLVKQLETTGGQDVLVRDLIWQSIINIIVILLTGETYEGNPHLGKVLVDFNRSIVPMMSQSFNLLTKYMPFLLHVPGTWTHKVWKDAHASRAKLMEFFFDNMRATWTPGSPRGIVDVLFDEQKKESAKEWFTDDHLKGLLMDMAAAGVSTTSGSLTAFIFLLMHHPDVAKKIQAELDRVIGPRTPRLEDRGRCSYTEAAILEMMRLSSFLPNGAGHLVREDVQYRGYTIPKGTDMRSMFWVSSRSEEEWGDPEVFRPDRFLDDTGDLLAATHPIRQQLFPFGVGKRTCPGEMFARARLFLYVCTLLQKFDILPPKSEKLLPYCDESWYMGAFRLVKPYHCVFRERNFAQ